MLDPVFSNLFSRSWLALQDIAPIIGAVVIILLVVIIAIVLFKWYKFMVKRGLEEYEREHRGVPPENRLQSIV